MRVAILSRGPELYSTRRLAESARTRGHEVRILDTLRLSMVVDVGRPALRYRGKELNHCDAVIPRIGASITFYGTAVVAQFEQMGVFTLSPSHAIRVSRDKLRSIQMLSRHHIGLPRTAFVRDKRQVLDAIEAVGGAPVIVKVLEGTQGVGVILAETTRIAQAIIETLQMARQNVLIQKFVRESKGRDMRALVVGGRVVAAMRRVAQGDDFRSNVHQGGRTEAVSLEPSYEQTAIRAAQIMGLHVAGVDMLESDEGPKVLEVNSSPGLEGIEGATRVDVAGAIIEELEAQVEFPEIDIRQRLTLKHGYGIVELSITDDSVIANKTLRDSRLREQDILVLNVLRGGISFPNPPGDQVILPGDLLLCFGKRLTLKQLLPPRATPERSKRSSWRNV